MARATQNDPGSVRAGRYISQPGGYRAFVPVPLIGVTNPAANDLVARFQKLGILDEITGQKRNRRFSYQAYINLFHNEGADEQP